MANVGGKLSAFLTVVRPKDTPLQRLKSSAAGSNVSLKFEYVPKGEACTLCRIVLNGIVFGMAEKKTQSEAKLEAVQQTLDMLSKNFPVLEVLHPFSITRFAVRAPAESFEDFVNREITKLHQDPTVSCLVITLDEDADQHMQAVQELCFFNGFQCCREVDMRQRDFNLLRITRKLDYLRIYMHVSALTDNRKYRVVGEKHTFRNHLVNGWIYLFFYTVLERCTKSYH